MNQKPNQTSPPLEITSVRIVQSNGHAKTLVRKVPNTRYELVVNRKATPPDSGVQVTMPAGSSLAEATASASAYLGILRRKGFLVSRPVVDSSRWIAERGDIQLEVWLEATV